MCYLSSLLSLSLYRACKLYDFAQQLVEGVALASSSSSSHEPDDYRKLHIYATTLIEKQNVCRKKSTDLCLYD
jgi:hypothetical protein